MAAVAATSRSFRRRPGTHRASLQLVVGKDGHTYNIRVSQSLGRGLDEQAIEAVSRWRFRPATLTGKPVTTEIAVEVDFHLY